MPQLIEVAFKGNRKEFFLWEQAEPLPPKAAVIVDADRGEDLGRVHAVGELAVRRCAGCAHGCGTESPTRRVRRLATDEEVERERQLREQDLVARQQAMERVKANGLVMKLSDAEWQWDRKKLTFYFTAEKRVDFRNLVRELAAMFRTRIELKQIGVRDEAKRLDGIGRCGRQYCSAAWLPELRPVNLGVAKDQRLSLNPSQISGACGRLMCCLRYEHEFYVQARKRFPKEGRTLRTARGEEKVIANDIFRDRVTLRALDGETRVVPLAELRREMAEVAGEPLAPEPAESAAGTAEVEMGSGTRELEDESPAEEEERSARRPQRGARGSARPTPPPPRASQAPASDAPAAAAPAAPAVPSTPAAPAAGEQEAAGDNGERRPHRRRGRRGGRRGRHGAPPRPDGGGDGSNGPSSTPPSSQGD